ncbi:hypothetical protein [Paracoccus sp. PAR01]|uniref:hypothetical protein n=1 Tax=Paracoccus sp. PAR01 TaxID=2769282 RepID=UPI0017875DCC|nr:hypothetical protein [Paracoccus sp. PAR01]MBD9528250.1 hypothetical protein [Paracoccus sp. PAR01]
MNLLTITEAAAQMNIPAKALRREAERHGLFVQFGRTVRIGPETIPKLIKKCRNAPNAHASISMLLAGNTSSVTLADQRRHLARETSRKLRSDSRSI